MNRSTTTVLATFSLLGCFAVTGCFLGYNPTAYAHFKLVLLETHVEKTDSDLAWILATILEAKRKPIRLLPYVSPHKGLNLEKLDLPRSWIFEAEKNHAI